MSVLYNTLHFKGDKRDKVPVAGGVGKKETALQHSARKEMLAYKTGFIAIVRSLMNQVSKTVPMVEGKKAVSVGNKEETSLVLFSADCD